MTEKKTSATIYKGALVLLFCAFLAGMAVTFTLSAKRGSRVVDANYYQNGLNYDRTESGAKNPGLSWKLSASMADGEVVVMVHDETGTPVSGGKLSFQPSRPGNEHTLHLSESSPGVFRSTRPAAPKGEVHGMLRFTRGEASASQRVVFFN